MLAYLFYLTDNKQSILDQEMYFLRVQLSLHMWSFRGKSPQMATCNGQFHSNFTANWGLL